MPIQTFTAADFARTAGHIGTTAMEADILVAAKVAVVAPVVDEVAAIIADPKWAAVVADVRAYAALRGQKTAVARNKRDALYARASLAAVMVAGDRTEGTRIYRLLANRL
tara:strand:- start:928 stop:1257 length:330 start_codon:yes stop_codon:yes gene_type:complete